MVQRSSGDWLRLAMMLRMLFRLAILGFSPSAGFEDSRARGNTIRLIRDVVGWLRGPDPSAMQNRARPIHM